MLRARTNRARESKNEANAEEVMSQKSSNFVSLYCKSESISKRIKRCRGNVSARKNDMGECLQCVAERCKVLQCAHHKQHTGVSVFLHTFTNARFLAHALGWQRCRAEKATIFSFYSATIQAHVQESARL